MNDALNLTEAALLAAQQATEATAALLLYVREGPFNDRIAFEEEVGQKLAEALGLALDIEAGDDAGVLSDEEKALCTDLRDAVRRFLEGWAG